MNKPKIEYKKRLVAFLDILGFKKRISQISQDAEKSIHFIKTIDELLRRGCDDFNDYERPYSKKLFSDCLCISCDYSLEAIYAMLEQLSYLQLHFSFGQVFIRGALSVGQHFENDLIIFSQGLVKAYELEKVAIYPRIIIDRELIDILLKDKGPSDSNTEIEYVMKSPDGTYFVDYLNWLKEVNYDVDVISLHKESLIDQVEANKTDHKILDKYRWLAEYHNTKINEFFKTDGLSQEHFRKLQGDLLILINEIFPGFEKIVYEA